MSNYKIRVYDWAPNGCNDISIEDANGRAVDGLEEALFGVDILKLSKRSYRCDWVDSNIIPLNKALKHLAVSPVSDGSDAIKLLKKYFKF